MYYRRAKVPGGTWFFTVNLADRHSDTLIRHIDDLRAVINKVKARHSFAIVAMVVLPEHLHAVWRLPPEDADYPLRWSLIKAGFSRLLDKTESIGASRQARRERGIWQRRYWEHQIRDADDLARHVDYVHYNPVKHGWVSRAADWSHSTLHGYIERGIIAADWGGGICNELGGCGER
jgi:putative transposase